MITLRVLYRGKIVGKEFRQGLECSHAVGTLMRLFIHTVVGGGCELNLVRADALCFDAGSAAHGAVKFAGGKVYHGRTHESQRVLFYSTDFFGENDISTGISGKIRVAGFCHHNFMKPVNLVLGQPVRRVFHFIVFNPGILKKGWNFQFRVITGNIFHIGIRYTAVVEGCFVIHFPID